MRVCPQCGTRPGEMQRFCNTCGAELPDLTDPPSVRQNAPHGHDLRGPVTARGGGKRAKWVAVVVAVLAAAGVVVALTLALKPDHLAATGVTKTSPGSTAFTGSDDQQTSGTTSDSETVGPTPSVQTTEMTTAPVQLVTVLPAAAADPRSPAVADLLTRYFRDVNGRDFVDYVELYAPAMRSKINASDLAAGYRTTVDTGAQLVRIRDAADGRPAADVAFRSTQDAADGPDGETCTNWQLTFFLEPNGVQYLIGVPPNTYSAVHFSC
jgi:hypothetical protein